MRVPRSQRGGEIVEPLVREQWFVRMEPLAKPALEVRRTRACAAAGAVVSLEWLPFTWVLTWLCCPSPHTGGGKRHHSHPAGTL